MRHCNPIHLIVIKDQDSIWKIQLKAALTTDFSGLIHSTNKYFFLECFFPQPLDVILKAGLGYLNALSIETGNHTPSPFDCGGLGRSRLTAQKINAGKKKKTPIRPMLCVSFSFSQDFGGNHFKYEDVLLCVQLSLNLAKPQKTGDHMSETPAFSRRKLAGDNRSVKSLPII